MTQYLSDLAKEIVRATLQRSLSNVKCERTVHSCAAEFDPRPPVPAVRTATGTNPTNTSCRSPELSAAGADEGHSSGGMGAGDRSRPSCGGQDDGE